jgi:hypothetical protein
LEYLTLKPQQLRHRPRLGDPVLSGPPFGQSNLEKYSTYSDISPFLGLILNNSALFCVFQLKVGFNKRMLDEARNAARAASKLN